MHWPNGLNENKWRIPLVDKSKALEVAPNILDTQKDSPAKQDTPKKQFITPEISVPVDVLEATTFFQITDSGVTN